MKRKLMSMALVLAMTLSLLPTSALAASSLQPAADPMEALPTAETAPNYVRSAPLVGVTGDPSQAELADPYGVTGGTATKDQDQHENVIVVPVTINAKGLTWHTATEDTSLSMYHIGLGILEPEEPTGITVKYCWDWGELADATNTSTNQYTNEYKTNPSKFHQGNNPDSIDDDGYVTFYFTSTGAAFASETGRKAYVAAEYTQTVEGSPKTVYVVYTIDFADPTRSTVTFNTVDVTSTITGCGITSPATLPYNASFEDLAAATMNEITLADTPTGDVVVVMGKDDGSEVELTSDDYTLSGTTITLKGDGNQKVTGPITIKEPVEIETVDVAKLTPTIVDTPDGLATTAVNSMKPDKSVVAEANVTWAEKNGSAFSGSTNFDSAKKYTATIKLTPAPGFKFTTDTKVSLDGGTAITPAPTPAADGTITITQDCDIALPGQITTVAITGLKPTVGYTKDQLIASITTAPTDKSAEVESVAWEVFSGEDPTAATDMGADAKFESGKHYIATITVKPLGIYKLSAANLTGGVTVDGETVTSNAIAEIGKYAIANDTMTIKVQFEAQAAPVANVPVESVALDKSSLTLNVGGTATLAPVFTPENPTNTSVTWASSDTSVATVSNGTVTAVAAGTADITVTTADGNKTATCKVTVSDEVTLADATATVPSGAEIKVDRGEDTITLTGLVASTDTSISVTCKDSAGNETPVSVAPGQTTTVTVGKNTYTVDATNVVVQAAIENATPVATPDATVNDSVASDASATPKEKEEAAKATAAIQEALDNPTVAVGATAGLETAVGDGKIKDADDGGLIIDNAADDVTDNTVSAAVINTAKDSLATDLGVDATEIKTVVRPKLEITVKKPVVDASTNETTGLVFEIDAYTEVVVTAAKEGEKIEVGEGKNSKSVAQKKIDMTNTNVTISLPLPAGFLTGDTWVKHTKSNNTSSLHWGRLNKNTNVLTFDNSLGFSTFTVLKDADSIVAQIGDRGFESLKQAVDSVKDGGKVTIKLLKDTKETVTVNKAVEITIDADFTLDNNLLVAGSNFNGGRVDKTDTWKFTKKATPVTPPSSGSGSGSGGGTGVWGGNSTSTPRVSVNSGSHGRVTTSSATPKKGDIVTLTITPDSGYELDVLTVTSGGQELDVDIDGNKATFEMPGASVSVKATFRAVGSEPGSGEEPADLPFADIPDDFWAYNEIAWAYNNGYMNGYSATSFNPSGMVTRQQLWMVLARISGENPSDMAGARDWAMANNVSDGSNPGNAVSRQQMVTMLYRYAQLNDYSTDGGTALDSYPDAGVVQSYATDALSWAVGNGIVNGTADGRLDPEGTAIRSQFAVILYRFCDTIAG